MKRWRSGWCETGFCSRCPELLQVANSRRREIHCDCPCHQTEPMSQEEVPPIFRDPAVLDRVARIILDVNARREAE